MTILFVTRKFQPAKGGMEKVADELYQHLLKITDVRPVKRGRSNKWQTMAFPYFMTKSLWGYGTYSLGSV